MDPIFYGIAELCQSLFELISALGNIPNVLFVICAIAAFAAWTGQLFKYRRLIGDEYAYKQNAASVNKTIRENEPILPDKKNEDVAVPAVQNMISPLVKCGEYTAFGISVQGKSHKKAEPHIPCQDNHKFGSVENKWHIAVVSDGAGSVDNSHLGSTCACEKLYELTSDHIIKNKWHLKEELPKKEVWQQTASELFSKTHKEIDLNEEEHQLQTLKCTLILVVHTPLGFLVAHVGDGRAGYRSGGEYRALMVPFQTFQVGATVFLTKENWKDFLRADIYRADEADAFFVISDGCDDFSFSQLGPVDEAEKGVYDKVYPDARYDHNKPFPGFYNALINHLKGLKERGEKNSITQAAELIIDEGVFEGKPVAGIQKELDDKTLVLFYK